MYSIPEVLRILKIVFIIEGSTLAALLVQGNNIIEIYAVFPGLNGIILAGVVASLAIVFGSLDSEGLARIYSLNHRKDSLPLENDKSGLEDQSDKNSSGDQFILFIESAKSDTRVIIFSFSFSIIPLLFGQFDFISISNLIGIDIFDPNLYFDVILRILLTIDIFFLILSISAVYDIINSLFTLIKKKYSWSSKIA